MRNLRVLRYVLLALSFCILVCAGAEAKSKVDKNAKPDIVWPHVAYDAIRERSDKVVDNGVCLEVAKLVDARLRELQEAGTLPFTVVDKEDSANPFDFKQDSEPQVTLIPLIVDDHAYESVITINGDKYDKKLSRCSIDIAFCYYPGSGESLRVLKVIPLDGYSVLGANGEYRQIGKDVEQKEFVTNAGKLINGYLTFSPKDKFFKLIKEKKYNAFTYQVTDVIIASEAAKKFYKTEDNLNLVRSLIGSTYTSAYAAEHPDLAILPSLTNGTWAENAAKGTASMSLGNAGKYLVMEPADKQIKLELSMLASFDVPDKEKSGFYVFKGFAAEIKNLTDGTTARDQVTEHMFLSTTQNNISYYLKGIFAKLFSQTASSLAEKVK